MKIDDRAHALFASGPAIGLYLGLERYMQEERAFAIALVAFVFYALIVIKWSSRHEASFWILLAVFAAVHIVALSAIAFPHYAGPSASVAVPFALADGLGMYALMSWFERRS